MHNSNWSPFCRQQIQMHFYPRPVLAFGCCRCLRLCVCVCLSVCLSVWQSLACPRDNAGPVQARITKFGPKMQKTLFKVPIVLWTDRPWPSRSNLTWKSKFTPFWACPHHNSPPIQARITKFGPEVPNTLVKIPIVFVCLFVVVFWGFFFFFFWGGGGGGGQLTLTFKVKYELKCLIFRFYPTGNT